MKIEIPSPMLVRLQVMFNSGMTLQEVCEALELETVDPAPEALQNSMPPQSMAPPEPQVQESPAAADTAIAAKSGSLPTEVIDGLYGLVGAVQELGKDVYTFAGHDKVRKSRSLSKTGQSLVSSTQSIAKLVNAINRYLPANPAEGTGPTAQKERWADPSAPSKTPSPKGLNRKPVEEPDSTNGKFTKPKEPQAISPKLGKNEGIRPGLPPRREDKALSMSKSNSISSGARPPASPAPSMINADFYSRIASVLGQIDGAKSNQIDPGDSQIKK